MLLALQKHASDRQPSSVSKAGQRLWTRLSSVGAGCSFSMLLQSQKHGTPAKGVRETAATGGYSILADAVTVFDRGQMRVNTHENWGRVVRHDNGGVSVVELTDSAGVTYSMRPLEMPTECIPVELRPLGTRLYFQWDGIWPEESDTAEELRARCRTAFRVLCAAPG
jgi:hypothetical protein